MICKEPSIDNSFHLWDQSGQNWILDFCRTSLGFYFKFNSLSPSDDLSWRILVEVININMIFFCFSDRPQKKLKRSLSACVFLEWVCVCGWRRRLKCNKKKIGSCALAIISISRHENISRLSRLLQYRSQTKWILSNASPVQFPPHFPSSFLPPPPLASSPSHQLS